MTKNEILEFALNALANSRDYIAHVGQFEKPPWNKIDQINECQEAITAIKAALEAKCEPERCTPNCDALLQKLVTQRTPITDEDIRQANHHMVDGAYDYSFKQGVRWAEKVHGIKWEWEA